MNHNNSKIFFRFKESIKITQAIQQTQLQIQIQTQGQTPEQIAELKANEQNNKIKAYAKIKCEQFLTFHNKILEIDEVQIYTLPFVNRYIYALIITKTNTNHPYMLFMNLDDVILTFLIPFGKEQKQADVDDYIEEYNNCKIPELSAIYLILEKTIYIRKYGLINSRFSLLTCTNITNCIKKFNEINKLEKLSVVQKNALKLQYNEFYLNKAVRILKDYFKLLDSKNYNEAEEYLKGTDPKFYGKERMNIFFKNERNVIGHLEIFISLYRLYHDVRMKLLKK